MTDIEKLTDIYSRLFDVVNQNMTGAGETFSYEKSTLLTNFGQAPRIVDVDRYEALDNKEYYQAAFVGAYKRLPEEKEEQPWKDRTKKDREEFRRLLLTEISGSSVFAIQHMKLKDNPYCASPHGIKYRVLGILYGLTDKSSLRTFGKKLPAPLQNIIRKVFL